MIKIVVYLIIAVTIAIIAARVLFRLPDISQRLPQAALPADPAALLPADPAALLPARAAELMAAHPGLSGVVPLASGHDAFASRQPPGVGADGGKVDRRPVLHLA
ncbi:hypothetical protein QZQ41_12370 [Serratia marcescens]|uniref:hypothetical protein n=1 Tax=Serratia marcescens TaxID=615 RepID=UPI001F15497D|nr:hypothetical protein [Serratia marcescens]MDP8615399.1 hypothetical protein [Serratia marcescens]MDP8645453.1 hypothetical protein [Serratia marcescens]MDP8655391.1 hypothetical protein [Serratia marcescens]MDP8660354.1 hypothetical protein [Serratia marcescens]MDP8679954.1 hypothetical protein [Serratia marcescens]